MKSFIRWKPPVVIEGYAEPALPEPCPSGNRYEFSLPIKVADKLQFISNVEDIPLFNGEGGIGLMNSACENVNYEIGTFVTSADNRQRAFTLDIPSVPRGCYYLVFYEKTYSTIGEWETINATCKIDENGNQNGFQDLEQQREITGLVRTPVAISNPLILIPDYDKNTKIIEYQGSGYDFGYDFNAFPDFLNIVRLPVTIAESSHIVNTKEYRQTNGVYRRGNTYIDKKYILHTEYFDEPTHDAMANALHHDLFRVDGKEYFASGEYAPSHQETALTPDRYHPMWPNSVELLLQGYNQRNNACDLEPSDFKVFDDSFSDVFE